MREQQHARFEATVYHCSASRISPKSLLILLNFCRAKMRFAKKKRQAEKKEIYCQLHNWTKRQITWEFLECRFDEDIFLRVARFAALRRNRKRPCLQSATSDRTFVHVLDGLKLQLLPESVSLLLSCTSCFSLCISRKERRKKSRQSAAINRRFDVSDDVVCYSSKSLLIQTLLNICKVCLQSTLGCQ